MWDHSIGKASCAWRRLCAVALAVAISISPLAACRTSNAPDAAASPSSGSIVIATAGPAAGLGAISGTVVHEGSPLPGVTITISSPTLQGTRVAVSNVNGDWMFRALPTGDYTIKLEMEGMATVTKTSRVGAGTVARVSSTLSLSSVAEAITVTAAAPSVIEGSAITAYLPSRNNGGTVRRSATYKEKITVTAAAPAVLETTEVQSNYSSAIVGALPVGRTAQSAASLAASGVPQAAVDACSCEKYASVVEGAFRRASEEPISTFSIDTDRASFSNVRRYLEFGALPPVDAVRVEEMINYFDYGYPDPTDGRPFSITTEIADCPWNTSHKLLRIGVQGRRMPPSAIPPGNLVFLVDVSGSMQSADKLPLVQASLKKLVRQLRDEDRVAIVVYASAEGLALPSTSGRDKWAIERAIDSLQAGGSTAGGAGIMLAYKIAADNYLRDGNNRVILATDGDFNVGASSNDALQQLIEAKRKEGVFLSVLGVGTGNTNDAGMELLADKGNGQYSYLDSLDEAEKVFVREMAGTLLTIAKDVKIQIEFNPARVGAYRLVGYDNRILDRKDFDDDTKDAGELGAGHSVTALYELAPPGGEREAGANGEAREEVPADERTTFEGVVLAHVKLRFKEPKADVSGLVETLVADSDASIYAASDDLRFVSAVAQFGLLLRESQYKGSASWKSVADLASSASSLDTTGDRAQFVKLAKKAEELQSRKIAQGTR
ncbi:MAG: von Willebrand factor type A domain-containing protein [Acidobacteria bacterium]|nr:von Willebrand factor type A domain-containing protein [Acidobacteriota bacterium]